MSEQFQRLGILATWDHPYLDDELQVPAAIARALGKFVEQGLVYKGRSRCTGASTAAPRSPRRRSSTPITRRRRFYVEFPLAPESEAELASRIPPLAGRQVSVLIWTTTPWTIPSNLAIAFHPEFDYAAYEVEGRAVIVAEALAPNVARRSASRSARRRAMKGASSSTSASSIRSTRARRSACSATT
jgi:isoleucyl-tRNA synthetase